MSDNLAAIRQLLASALVLMEGEERNSIEPWIRGDVSDALAALEQAENRS